MKFRFYIVMLALVLSTLLLSACGRGAYVDSGKLDVVVTTTILGDVVGVIGGDRIELTVLLPVNADPHSFQPTPRDLAAVAEADVVFINGLGLEESLEAVVENAVENARIVAVSEGVETISIGEEREHSGANPHVWMAPHNVIVWAENIALNLGELDPHNVESYTANAEAYIEELEVLDSWILEQVAALPEENRKIVTDHDTFAYFLRRYGFELVGTINPGFSTLAEPSAQDIAALEDEILALNVPVVFVGVSVNPNLAERVAEDTGTQLVFLYTGSLSGKDGPAPTYLEMMRYNVRVMVGVLE
jgi:manganese/iron transport system substrate-binding protein